MFYYLTHDKMNYLYNQTEYKTVSNSMYHSHMSNLSDTYGYVDNDEYADWQDSFDRESAKYKSVEKFLKKKTNLPYNQTNLETYKALLPDYMHSLIRLPK